MKETVYYIILEDEDIISLGLQHTISMIRPHYELLSAKESALDASELLNDDRVDLIITDVCYADGFCFEMLRSIGCNKPLIVFTGYEQYRDNFKGLNIIDFSLKPISPEQLERSLSRFEEQYQISKFNK